MNRYEQWGAALRQARSAEEVEAIIAECRDGLAAGDKIGWSVAARGAVFDPDLDAAAAILQREQARFNGEPEARATLEQVAGLFEAAARRLGQIEPRSPDAT
jgi:hypothetical protein